MKHLKYFLISSLVQASGLWAGLEAPTNLSEADARFWDACVEDIQKFQLNGGLRDQPYWFANALCVLYPDCPIPERLDAHLPVLPQLVYAFLQEDSQKIYSLIAGVRLLDRLNLDAFLTALEAYPLTPAQREQVAGGLLLVTQADYEYSNKISPEMFERIDRSFAGGKLSARLTEFNQRGIQLSDLKEIEENLVLWGVLVRFYTNSKPLAPETLSALISLFPKPGYYSGQQLYGAFLKRLLSSFSGWEISALAPYAPIFEFIHTQDFVVEADLLKDVVSSWTSFVGQESKSFCKSIFNLYLHAGVELPDSYFSKYRELLARIHSGEWTSEDLKNIDADPYLYNAVLSTYKPQVLDQKLFRFLLKKGWGWDSSASNALNAKNAQLHFTLKETLSTLVEGKAFCELDVETVEYILRPEHLYAFKNSVKRWAPVFETQHPLFWNFAYVCPMIGLPEPQASIYQEGYNCLSWNAINDVDFVNFLRLRGVTYALNFQTLKASSDFMATYTKGHLDPLPVHLYDATLSHAVKGDLNRRLEDYYDYKTGGQLLEDYKQALQANKSHQAAIWHVIAVLQSQLQGIKESTLAHIAAEGLGQRLEAFVRKIDTKVAFLEKLKYVSAQAREVGFFQEGRSPEVRGMVLKHTFVVSGGQALQDLDPARRMQDHNSLSRWRALQDPSTPGYFLWLETLDLLSYISLKIEENRYTPNTLDVEGRCVMIQNGCAFTTANGNAITPNTSYLYALRANGDLHILASGSVNHNNVLLGENAVSAGYVTFDKEGKIVLITNGSGHYQPKGTQLHNAVSILHNQNVFAKNAEVQGHSEGNLPVETFLKKHPLRQFFRLDKQTQQKVRERLLERAQELRAVK